jgi:hypothetical protein
MPALPGLNSPPSRYQTRALMMVCRPLYLSSATRITSRELRSHSAIMSGNVGGFATAPESPLPSTAAASVVCLRKSLVRLASGTPSEVAISTNHPKALWPFEPAIFGFLPRLVCNLSNRAALVCQQRGCQHDNLVGWIRH